MSGLRARLDALDTLSVMRLGLLGLAVGAVLVTAAELTFLAHWDGTLQLLPWMALVSVALAIVLVAVRPGRGTIRIARALAGVSFLLGAVGVLVHVISNRDAGVLDYRYTATWPTMSELQRWWLAATGGVGPTPSLAPMSLAFSAVLVLLASIRVPVRATSPVPVAVQPARIGYDDPSPP